MYLEGTVRQPLFGEGKWQDAGCPCNPMPYVTLCEYAPQKAATYIVAWLPARFIEASDG